MTDPTSPAAGPGLEFPCAYPLKLIGRRSPEFARQMLEVIDRGPAQRVGEPAERNSRDGTYVSLAVTVQVGSREELDALYRALHATGLVLFAL